MSHEATQTPRISPGSTIGMVGGGQLGRMTAIAAAPLGLRTHVYSATPDSPAAQACAAATVADWDDHQALDAFAASVDVITYEWENIAVETLEYLAKHRRVSPAPHIQEVAQDRGVEKRFVNDAGLATTDFVEIDTRAELEAAVAELGGQCVVKTARFGYDGKGQARIGSAADVKPAWQAIGQRRAIVEAQVDFVCEMSVIVARSPSGQTAVYDPVVNNHVDGVLNSTEAPAPVAPAICRRAVDIGRTLADAFDLAGLLGVELFLTGDDQLLVNEVAPRPHNSGHWTIDACQTSQFEQFARAVCDLPLGSPRRHSDALMDNLLGPVGNRWMQVLEQSDASLHLYGKHDAYAGRKMGHVTQLSPRSNHDYAYLGD